MERRKLLVSFSGGETSAFMAQWLWNNRRHEFDMVFVFANTGQENEETLDFVRKCGLEFRIPIVWVEAKVFHDQRRSTTFITTDYWRASRDGEPFEDVISKYGIPNISTPHCTRELKQNPIKAYAKSIGWKDYYTAIGIRADEIGRINSNYKKNKFIYPLAFKEFKPMTKKHINFWWSQQSFRLELKGYQGNCVTCWKKSDNKLYQIAKENQKAFFFMDKMEQKYGNFIPESRLKLMSQRGETPKLPTTFFRKSRNCMDIINESKGVFKTPSDDSLEYNTQEEINFLETEDLLNNESCEVFSDCGNDN